MFAKFLYRSTDGYFLLQLDDCGAIIKVRQNYVQQCCNRIVVTIRRLNTTLEGKNVCSIAKRNVLC